MNRKKDRGFGRSIRGYFAKAKPQDKLWTKQDKPQATSPVVDHELDQLINVTTS